MARWHPTAPVDERFFHTAPVRHVFPVRLTASAEQVWASLVSDRSVADWGPLLSSLDWTSPRPFGVGTTRQVVLPLRTLALRERFFRWDDGAGYSFHTTAVDRPGIRRFAEDYRVVARGEGTLFTWTIAIDPVPALLPAMRAAAPLLRAAFGRMPAGARRHFGTG